MRVIALLRMRGPQPVTVVAIAHAAWCARLLLKAFAAGERLREKTVQLTQVGTLPAFVGALHRRIQAPLHGLGVGG